MTFQRYQNPDHPDWPQIWELYQKSFPACELRLEEDHRLWFYAEKWGGDCIQAAALGGLLNYIYLVKISERSSVSRAKKNANVVEISDAMHREGTFQRCSDATLRLDNRLIVKALESRCCLLVRLVAHAVEKVKDGRKLL